MFFHTAQIQAAANTNMEEVKVTQRELIPIRFPPAKTNKELIPNRGSTFYHMHVV